jgi:hypothetical protein
MHNHLRTFRGLIASTKTCSTVCSWDVKHDLYTETCEAAERQVITLRECGTSTLVSHLVVLEH